MIPQRHPKIIKNLIWVPLAAQPGLQAPSGHPQKLPRLLPDLFFGVPGTLLDMFLEGFEQQNKMKKNNKTKKKEPKQKCDSSLLGVLGISSPSQISLFLLINR